jgi:hypothetical protein
MRYKGLEREVTKKQDILKINSIKAVFKFVIIAEVSILRKIIFRLQKAEKGF